MNLESNRLSVQVQCLVAFPFDSLNDQIMARRVRKEVEDCRDLHDLGLFDEPFE